MNAIPESAILTDVDGIILAANETIARRFGKLTRQLIGAQFYDLLPRRWRTPGGSAEECVRTGEPLHFEDMRFGRYIDNYVYPIKDARGQVKRLAILGVGRHRAQGDRAEAEGAGRPAGRRLGCHPGQGPGEPRFSTGTRARRACLRVDAVEEAVGRDAAAFLSPARVCLWSGLTRATRHAGRRANGAGTSTRRTKDGRELIVEGRWTLVRDENGKPKGILSVNSDVTAQRSIQAQLLRSQRLESLGTLAGGIAHDLNNVLSPILMGVEGLSFRIPTTPRGKSWKS